jgi:hypothetical protein
VGKVSAIEIRSRIEIANERAFLVSRENLSPGCAFKHGSFTNFKASNVAEIHFLYERDKSTVLDLAVFLES